jgi:hypothetical protein
MSAKKTQSKKTFEQTITEATNIFTNCLIDAFAKEAIRTKKNKKTKS